MQALLNPKTMLVLAGFLMACVILAGLWRGAVWLLAGPLNEKQRENLAWRGYCPSATLLGIYLYVSILLPSFSPSAVPAQKPTPAPAPAPDPNYPQPIVMPGGTYEAR